MPVSIDGVDCYWTSLWRDRACPGAEGESAGLGQRETLRQKDRGEDDCTALPLVIFRFWPLLPRFRSHFFSSSVY
ncbi:MAG: hypothetical protein SwBeaMacB_25730 [Shewanella algae]|uniref:Uncharacterized protein n=1 Tax=Shewanella carassii TaxID=1987584 RepID=A0ABQ1SZ88_9GAMM|nr:hypothetical protein TUM17377_32310 [Shewanella chilikensis]BCV42128.1 hypothetical protein TUM17378_33900 [Shewanella algae]BCV50854.1 hypothetical protein TUM17382_35470 [Shewanella algae]BCV65460.1 hypothetical protein TUM17387_08190 [Shewanella carassii]GGE73293.1 hypothetical protein GCM10011520_12310 [Shewanella carassii]